MACVASGRDTGRRCPDLQLLMLVLSVCRCPRVAAGLRGGCPLLW